ncbi:class I SAM-dependent methyltransferase [Candidatus Parcubacteria bacterium]|nr:MAG: class I SAM-dependent methyltransferase [Candidatus Parcubacteria bacterium]
MNEKFVPALAFEFLTPLYDFFSSLVGYGKRLHRRVLDIAALSGRERILDVGSGTASLLIEVKKRFPMVIASGIDPDEQILDIAKKKLARLGIQATLAHGFARKLPFRDASFDVAISTLVFHHLSADEKRRALDEIYRVLVKNGRFVLADFGKPQSFVSYVLLRILSIFDGQENMRSNLAGKLPVFLKEAGFQVEERNERYRGLQFLIGLK